MLIENFAELAYNLDMINNNQPEDCSFTRYGWIKRISPTRNPDDNTAKKFFQILLEKKVFVQEDNDYYVLIDDYSDIIRELYEKYNKGKFIEHLSAFYRISQ
jgi:hypothetical protein